MTSKIQHRRSSVPGKVPTTGQIDLGELAINTRDGKLYLKRDNGDGTFTVIDLGAVRTVAGKAGDVTLDRGDVGLGNVDNTADANKPVSGPQQTALNAKVNTARQLATGAGLTGGGNLGADRTLAADIATEAEAQAGTSNAKLMTALRTKQIVDMQGGFGTAGYCEYWDWNNNDDGAGYRSRVQNDFGRPILLTWTEYSSSGSELYLSATEFGNYFFVGTSRYSVSASIIIPTGWWLKFEERSPDFAVVSY